MNIFSSYYRDNLKLVARTTKPSESFRSLVPVRVLVHIPKRFRVRAGDIIRKNEHTAFLLAEHHAYGLNNVFLGLSINAEAEVIYSIRVRHPVTGLETNGFSTESETLPCVQEIETPTEVKGLTVSQEVFYFGTEIPKDAKVNGRTVTKVTPVSGVYRVEV
ncbi:hypothetical protein KUL118_01670 [Tenacibaculum sp. KUL118]|nr:hypothetical protein KUL118_01670 [Tenacibaculum sp. KUL118]